jgi:hypothetical protein
MECTGCRREKTQVLLAGDSVCSWCPAWALECRQRDISARIVLGIGDRAARERWLLSYADEYGDEAATRLRETVKFMWPDRAELSGRLASKKG